MICRVFQKSAAKKYPTNHQSRTVLNPYNLEIGPSVVAASPMMQLGDSTQFPYGRNFMSNPSELAELSRVFRGGSSSTTSSANLSIPSHLNYPVGGAYFTMSGLNLNLGGGPPAHHVFRPMPPPGPPAMNQQDINITSSSMSMMTSGSGGSLAVETGYGTDMNNNNNNTVQPNGPPSNRSYMNMEHCMDLDNYWPTY